MKQILTLLIAFTLAACSTDGSSPAKTQPDVVVVKKPVDLSKLNACKVKVHNRGVIKDEVLKDLVEWAQKEDYSVFALNDNADVYSLVYPQLGPYKSNRARVAAMAEVLRVLGGFESSWDYDEGRDKSADNTSDCTREAGIFQTSGNSSYFSSTLKDFQAQHCGGDTSCKAFESCSKDPPFNKPFIFGYTARLLRFTTAHHGPLKRPEDVRKWLSRECAAQIEAHL